MDLRNCVPCRKRLLAAGQSMVAAQTQAAVPYDLAYYDRTLRNNSGTARQISNIRWEFVWPALRIEKPGQTVTVLDVGAGVGWFRAFAPPGAMVDSTDVGLAPQTGIRHKVYDLVTFWDVLEHIADLATMSPFLNAARAVAVTVPIRPDGVPAHKWRHTKPGEHVREFTPETLLKLMEDHGLRWVKSGYPECPPRHDILSALFVRNGEPTPLPDRVVAGEPAPGRARKIILVNSQCPGDGIAMSRALIDLKTTYPHWQVDVRTNCNQLYRHCPLITPLKEGDPDVEVVRPTYSGIHQSNQAHTSYAEAWSNDLERLIGAPLQRTGWTPKLWLSKDEEKRPADVPAHYWVLAASHKKDCELKRYQDWQAVVTLMEKALPEVKLVQVGHSAHPRPDLRGANVINWVGKSDKDQRLLLRWVYHADGVFCHLSGPFLYAAALEKPYVCVAGGREPFQWQQTPSGRFLQTVGQVACCSPRSCWKSNTKDCRAFDPVRKVARCMSLIMPERIVEEAVNFYRGGRIAIPTAWRLP
jgi:hypothetical protein